MNRACKLMTLDSHLHDGEALWWLLSFLCKAAGQFAAALVALLTTIGFRKSFSTALDASTCLGDCQLAANQAWRIIIGVGAFPALFALYCRRRPHYGSWDTTLYIRCSTRHWKGRCRYQSLHRRENLVAAPIPYKGDKLKSPLVPCLPNPVPPGLTSVPTLARDVMARYCSPLWPLGSSSTLPYYYYYYSF